MGLNSEDAVLKKEGLEGCIEPAAKVPMMMNNPKFLVRPGARVYSHFRTGIQTTPQLVIPWYASMGDSVPAQLTIFYNGVVNVYDGVSPEKAQAIMLLAGNGHLVAMGDEPQERIQAEEATQAWSPVSSPMSVSSHRVDQLTGGQPNETEAAAAKRIMSSLGEAMQSAAIPQSRKASLARFLEKRRERVMMASAPYSLSSKNSVDFCASNSSSNTHVIPAAAAAGEGRKSSNKGECV